MREAGEVCPRDQRALLAPAEQGRAAVPQHALPFRCQGAGREKIFPARRGGDEDKRMGKYLIDMGFLATGGIGSRPASDFSLFFPCWQGIFCTRWGFRGGGLQPIITIAPRGKAAAIREKLSRNRQRRRTGGNPWA